MFLRALLLSSCLALPARACDLALLLAVDVSGSVSPREYEIQRDGLAAALQDSIVGEALVQANAQVAVMQWTGASRQRVTIPWTQVDSFAALEQLVATVAEDKRVWRNFSTAIGEAFAVALETFERGPDCRRRVMDVSGDGTSNEGISPRSYHPAFRAAGITVNGLVIEGAVEDLTGYYWENVITGPGAFVMTANRHAEYPARIREKLIREVVQQVSEKGSP